MSIITQKTQKTQKGTKKSQGLLLVDDVDAGVEEGLFPGMDGVVRGDGEGVWWESESLSFAFTEGVIGHDFEADGVFELLGEASDGLEAWGGAVDVGEGGETDEDGDGFGVESEQVVADGCEGDAGEGVVSLVVGFLDVEHGVVEVWEELVEGLPGGEAGGFDGG